MEQEEYTKEGINWQHIAFVDNQDVLDMIGIKSLNIMALIDEESKFPKGTDSTMLSKLHSTHSTKTIYIKPKSDQTSNFAIQHFAGVVFYNPNGKSNFKTVVLLRSSSNQLVICRFSWEEQGFSQYRFEGASRHLFEPIFTQFICKWKCHRL